MRRQCSPQKDHRHWLSVAAAFLFLLWCAPAAASTCDPWVARIVSIEGRVETRTGEEGEWRAARPGETFCFGDQVRVEENSRAAVNLQDHTFIRLDARSTIEFSRKEERSWLDVLNGLAHFFSRTPRDLNIFTPFVNASVEGTEFLIEVGPTEAVLSVFEGKVSAANEQGDVRLEPGQAAVARQAAPLIIRPVRPLRDAVQWALYYPPVLPFAPDDFDDPAPESWQAAAVRSIEFYQAGDPTRAFEALENVAGDVSDARFFVYRASLRLSVGRVEGARVDIDRALSLNPVEGNAYALRAVIALVQEDRAAARAAADQAVALAPDTPGPHLASSLAWQAEFELEKARRSAKKAVEAAPDRALGWARLAEIHLMFGELEAALAAARKGAALDPTVAHTQMVLGFAHLSRIDLGAAQAAFEEAISLDPAAPLPRLGLGLLKIREGSLEEGRREIETAALLDPGNALIRSYLGKAYFEEKKESLASEQYDMAKTLDERDPTPYLYHAILQQTRNRPVLALQEIQRSIALNDARAVYRSRLLLDEDLAVRSASLGRIYQDLGFEQRALVEGWKSVTLAPEDPSGHRLLADTYAVLPQQQQIARASELLQSQLFQEINITPIQPQLAETNLAILEGTGPSELSFNEFNPLFTRNRVAVQVDGVIGNHSTFGNDLVLSAIQGPLSFSVGQFHYESDGFRENNDFTHDVYNLYVQAAVTSNTNLQVELRRRETEQGDIRLNFNPADFLNDFRREIRQDSVRLGARHSARTDLDLIASVIHYDREAAQEIVDLDFDERLAQELDAAGYQAEAQLLLRKKKFNSIVGVSRYGIDNRLRTILEFPGFVGVERTETEQVSETLYLYHRLFFPDTAVWTIGASYQTVEESGLDLEEFNPKLGLQWDMTARLHLRAAYMKTIKQGLIVEQTIEPTQVAGFNQLIDDFNGTRARRHGVGLDAAFSENLLGGIEGAWYDLQIPDFTEPITFLDFREAHYRAYAYWTFHEGWAVSAVYRLDAVRGPAPAFDKLNTTRVPVSIKYFSPLGGLVKIETTYLSQKIQWRVPDIFEFNREETLLVDLSIGFRLPKRVGLVTFEVKNLFDRAFLYQDTSFMRNEPVYPEVIPDRTYLVRANVNFW